MKRKDILEALTRQRLLDVAYAFELGGLSTARKEEIVETLARSQAIRTDDLLAELYQDELKDLCAAAELKTSGSKQTLIDRIQGREGGRRTDRGSPRRSRHAAPAAGASTESNQANSMTAQNRRRGAEKGSRRKPASAEDAVSDYRHASAKRTNNPPAKIAAEGEVPTVPKANYQYNPHLPPKLRFGPDGDYEHLLEKARKGALSDDEIQWLAQALEARQPWLEWTEKQEQDAGGKFEVDPVALHIHERVAPQAILKAAARQDAERSLFADPQQQYHEAVQFYKHEVDWTNRLILGDSLQVMSSLARRENLAGKVQMIYIDPPYGIKFASNFQPEVGKRDVGEKDTDLTREPEMVKAYRDTWHLGIHSYLGYLRARLIASKELLTESKSVFVQIGDENIHRVRQLMEKIFGAENYVTTIAYKTAIGMAGGLLDDVYDHILWFSRNKHNIKYRQLYDELEVGKEGASRYKQVESARTGEVRLMDEKEREDPSLLDPKQARLFISLACDAS